MAKIGFIGMGNMGMAIMKGLLKSMPPEEILFSSAHTDRMEKISKETGVAHAASNAFPTWPKGLADRCAW